MLKFISCNMEIFDHSTSLHLQYLWEQLTCFSIIHYTYLPHQTFAYPKKRNLLCLKLWKDDQHTCVHGSNSDHKTCQLFIYLSIHLLIYVLIYAFIYSFTNLFFIYLFVGDPSHQALALPKIKFFNDLHINRLI